MKLFAATSTVNVVYAKVGREWFSIVGYTVHKVAPRDEGTMQVFESIMPGHYRSLLRRAGVAC